MFFTEGKPANLGDFVPDKLHHCTVKSSLISPMNQRCHQCFSTNLYIEDSTTQLLCSDCGANQGSVNQALDFEMDSSNFFFKAVPSVKKKNLPKTKALLKKLDQKKKIIRSFCFKLNMYLYFPKLLEQLCQLCVNQLKFPKEFIKNTLNLWDRYFKHFDKGYKQCISFYHISTLEIFYIFHQLEQLQSLPIDSLPKYPKNEFTFNIGHFLSQYLENPPKQNLDIDIHSEQASYVSQALESLGASSQSLTSGLLFSQLTQDKVDDFDSSAFDDDDVLLDSLSSDIIVDFENDSKKHILPVKPQKTTAQSSKLEKIDSSVSYQSLITFCQLSSSQLGLGVLPSFWNLWIQSNKLEFYSIATLLEKNQFQNRIFQLATFRGFPHVGRKCLAIGQKIFPNPRLMISPLFIPNILYYLFNIVLCNNILPLVRFTLGYLSVISNSFWSLESFSTGSYDIMHFVSNNSSLKDSLNPASDSALYFHPWIFQRNRKPIEFIAAVLACIQNCEELDCFLLIREDVPKNHSSGDNFTQTKTRLKSQLYFQEVQITPPQSTNQSIPLSKNNLKQVQNDNPDSLNPLNLVQIPQTLKKGIPFSFSLFKKQILYYSGFDLSDEVLIDKCILRIKHLKCFVNS